MEEALLPTQGADDILGLFRKMKGDAPKTEEKKEGTSESPVSVTREAPAKISVDLTKLFEFGKLDQVETLAHVLNGYYRGENDLYHNLQRNRYVLMVHKSSHTPEEFNKVCNIASEYALQRTYTNAIGSYYTEHGRLIIKGNALQVLADI